MSPIDLIPDFISVLGHLDDLVIVPALIAAALWMVPDDVVSECAAQYLTAGDEPSSSEGGQGR
jgi:uncharacterized membrane protein YkvA (DUF1232 family)